MPTAQRINQPYIDPEIESEYKRKIKDLEMELHELKIQHKKQ